MRQVCRPAGHPSMRALFTLYGPNTICGPNVWMTRMLPLLRPHGLEPRVLYVSHTPEEPCAFRTALEANGVGGTAVRLTHRTEDEVPAILAGIAAEQPDIFVPNCLAQAYFAARFARDAGIRTIGTLHSDDPFYDDMLDLFVSGDAQWRLDALVTVSEYLQERATAAAPPGMRIVQATYGVPTIALPAAPPDNDLTLLYAGRLVEHQKRIRRVTARLCSATSAIPGVRAVIHGDGPNQHDVEAILAARGASRVTLAGSLAPEPMLEAMRQAHAFVLLSDFEGLSIALMEAMASGLVPMVAPMRSGVGDLLRHDVNALIVDPNDEGAFVESVRRLRDEPGLWRRLSAAARQTIIDRGLTSEECARRWAALCHASGARTRVAPLRIPSPDQLDLPRPCERPFGFKLFDRRDPHTYLRLAVEDRRPVYVWGAGSGGRRCLAQPWMTSRAVAGIIDRRASERAAGAGAETFEGIALHPPAHLAARAAGGPRPFVVIASMHEGEIGQELETFGFVREQDFISA
jgi:colanic acid/amylovoran biosynthesis glycosyltransferase